MIADFFFVLFAVMAIGGATAMVFSRNPVASLLYLVMAFFAMSGIFVLLDAHFIAAVNVIVYAGAILVLFLFVIMLLNLGHTAKTDLRGPLHRMVGIVVAGAMFGLLLVMLRGGHATSMAGGMGQATLDAMLQAQGAVGVVAEPMFRSYLVPFEITSLLLLVAIVGAIVLARRRAP
jgi:NADH-quinone oxidoreductase subunit J